MKKFAGFGFALFAIALLIGASSWKSAGSLNKSGAEKINWMTWQEVQKAQKTNPKKVFVDVYTDWCGWCKKMDATTFSHPSIVKYLNENFYSIKFDAETKEAINFKGKSYNFVPNGRRGYNELAAELLNGRLSYPTTLYLDESLNVLSIVPGFQQPKSLDEILNFFASNNYLQMNWETFQRQYQSPLK